MRRGGDTGPQAASSPGGERIYSPPGTEDDITGTVCRTVLRSGAVTNFYETRRKKGNCAPRFQRRPCPRRPRAPLHRRFPPPALRPRPRLPPPALPTHPEAPAAVRADAHTPTASISSTPYRLRTSRSAWHPSPAASRGRVNFQARSPGPGDSVRYRVARPRTQTASDRPASQAPSRAHPRRLARGGRRAPHGAPIGSSDLPGLPSPPAGGSICNPQSAFAPCAPCALSSGPRRAGRGWGRAIRACVRSAFVHHA